MARLPAAASQILSMSREGAISGFTVLWVAVLAVGIVVTIVFMERSQRRLLIQYPKRQVGNRMFGGELLVPAAEDQHLGRDSADLRLDASAAAGDGAAVPVDGEPAGLGFLGADAGGPAQHGRPLFMVLYGALIIFFTFFYTSIVFNPEETAENLRKYGGFLPGIRPGKRTAEYLDYVLTRLTVIGAAYITLVCLVPESLMAGMQSSSFYFGGTSILIVVSVTMDTWTQIQSHLLAHQYEGLIKKSRLRGKGR